jgi:hypothetical protein
MTAKRAAMAIVRVSMARPYSVSPALLALSVQ